MTTNSEEPKGLGDSVEKIIEKIGDMTRVEFIRRRKGCEGCRQRKEMLNKLFPYQENPETSDTPEPTPSEKPKKEGCKSCGQKKKKKSNCKNCDK